MWGPAPSVRGDYGRVNRTCSDRIRRGLEGGGGSSGGEMRYIRNGLEISSEKSFQHMCHWILIFPHFATLPIFRW
ncbi:conserved hypothetical protein [Ricinus communis]|uniref:Uncharacterized protein n=1 Tax=Ricinus communis TaxID=3988 RepID=B9T265_RICCO|nr:conserved hypothetical protein [Ricinus communis]